MIKKLTLFLILGAILGSFGLGTLFGKSQVICSICSPDNIDFSLFWQTWKKLENEYVYPDELDEQAMIYGAISGMVESIGDPYTVFLNPDDSKVFSEDISGEFEGVGMEIGIRKGSLQVIAPLEGTPAQKAGIRAGDIIIKIDGNLITDISIDEVVKLIRGPKGTEVVLTVFREGWEEDKDIKIIRDVVEVPSLRWELKEGNVAYIKIYHFTERADIDFSEISKEILDSPAEKIVLDLRNNPGGYLGVAQNIAGWFLEEDDIVAIEDFGKGKERKYYRAEGPGLFSEYPMVCLINQGAASASEILAGALRDNRDIVLIGETSFGKGLVQEFISLRDDSNLKVTVARWLTPKEKSINGVGLEPDIKIEVTEEDYQNENDVQLEKAIEIVSNTE